MRARGWVVVVGALVVVFVAAFWVKRRRHVPASHPAHRADRGESDSSDRLHGTTAERRADAGAAPPSHYSGRVPAATAHDAWEWEDGILGQAGVRIRMFLGTHKPFMESTHSGEARQSDWAGAM